MKVISLLIVFFLASNAVAWDDCPFGLVNDSEPGLCARYADLNSDQLCDHSEPPPSNTPAQSAPMTTLKTVSVPTQNVEVISRRSYNLIMITVVTTAAYILTLYLSRRKTISIITHRRIWNVILLVSFLFCGLLGVLLIAQISYGVTIRLPFNMLYWHVEAGVLMMVVSVFHMLWHIDYYKCMLLKSPGKKCDKQ